MPNARATPPVVGVALEPCDEAPGGPGVLAPERRAYASVRDVAWQNERYAGDDECFRAEGGAHFAPGQRVLVREPSYGDLTGDGQAEAIVRLDFGDEYLSEGRRQADFRSRVHAYAVAGGELRRLEGLPVEGADEVRIERGVVVRVVRERETARCPDECRTRVRERAERWRWDGHALVEDVGARRRGAWAFEELPMVTADGRVPLWEGWLTEGRPKGAPAAVEWRDGGDRVVFFAKPEAGSLRVRAAEGRRVFELATFPVEASSPVVVRATLDGRVCVRGPNSAVLVARVNGGVVRVIAWAPLEPEVPAWCPITEAY